MKLPRILSVAFGLIFLTHAAWAQSLGTTNLVEGSTAGSDSVVLAANGPWTATTNATWLHLSAANQSGTGSTNVIFTFDANTGATRNGTLTIASQSLALTQAGSTYVVVTNLTKLVSSGLSSPNGVAVDGAGNVYFADQGNNAIKEWVVASNTVTTLVSTGLSSPYGVAVDGAGNVYIDDSGNSAIKEWIAASNTVTTVVSSGLINPQGMAVDSGGNVYIADTGNNVIKEWVSASNTVITLVSSGLFNPRSVAVDGTGNVYIADTIHNAIKEWIATSNTVTTLVSSGLSSPSGVAVDGAGNVYIADTINNAIKKWITASNVVTTLVSSKLYQPRGVAVDGFNNIYIANTGSNSIIELPHALVDSTPKVETTVVGVDSLPVVLPATVNLTGPFAPTSDSPWLTIAGVANGVVTFGFAAINPIYSRTAHINLLGQSIAVTTPSIFALGTTNLLEAPAAGSDSMLLAANGAWTAATNASWLHLSAGYQSGTGGTNVVFTFDANLGTTRTGTLTIAGQTLTVTQAGSTYVAANSVTALVSSGLSSPSGVAVDGIGNIYIADTLHLAIKEWIGASNMVVTLVPSGLNQPRGVALDGYGNVYIADTGSGAIREWIVASNAITTLVSSGLSSPYGVAVDGVGNVYIAGNLQSAIKEWIAASNTVTTLVFSGLNQPRGVAVDVFGNVYIADTFNNAVKEWIAASHTVTPLVSSGLSQPTGVAVDGSGNVYIANLGSIKEWILASNAVTTLVSSGLSSSSGVAVDGAGNVYIADTGNNAIKELPHAFVDSTPKVEPATPGNDTLPMVLPATANLTGLFVPVSDSPWLTISGVTNGVVSIAFTANTAANRTAHIALLGQIIAITQTVPPNYFFLGTNILVEGPAAGSDSVVLSAGGSWTATANDSWLHLSVPNESGMASTNVVFTFDANTGATRTGTLTIAGQTLNVIQAGSTYVAAKPVSLVFLGFSSFPNSVAVDGAGNVYIANVGNGTISEWIAASNVVTTLVSGLGVLGPYGVAVDGAGNVYIADTGNYAIKEWVAASNTVITLVSSGLYQPSGVAVDGFGNVYFAGTSGTGKWTAATKTVSTLVSGSSQAVALDAAGNVYIANFNNSSISEWSAASGTVTTLASSGFIYEPTGVAVDGMGNVYAANLGNGFVTEWIAASNSVAVLASFGPASATGVALDGAGNLYIAHYTSGYIFELLSHTFMDATAKAEPAAGGMDALPSVLPASVNLTGPFAPASDSAWLSISGITNGVVSFAFTPNYSINRTAHITLLGQKIAVTQPAVVPPVLNGFTTLNNGAFQFGFTNNQGVSFTVWSSTNLALPLTNWTVLASLTNDGSGQFQFTDPAATNNVQQFYRVTSP